MKEPANIYNQISYKGKSFYLRVFNILAENQLLLCHFKGCFLGFKGVFFMMTSQTKLLLLTLFPFLLSPFLLCSFSSFSSYSLLYFHFFTLFSCSITCFPLVPSYLPFVSLFSPFSFSFLF